MADVAPLLYSRALQMGDEKKAARMALGEAVAQGIIANQTLAYFIGRTYLFAKRVGGWADAERRGIGGGVRASQTSLSVSSTLLPFHPLDPLLTHPPNLHPPPLLQIGLNPDRVRFRQHLQHEMAHYAEDCWDFEVECSYGWVECAGLADRSAYDLNVSAGGRGGFVRRRQPSCVRGGGCVWGASDQKQA